MFREKYSYKESDITALKNKERYTVKIYDNDLGPIMKVLPTLTDPSVPKDSIIFIIDDDIQYSHDFINTFLKYIEQDSSVIILENHLHWGRIVLQNLNMNFKKQLLKDGHVFVLKEI